jgi:hypothetical protein
MKNIIFTYCNYQIDPNIKLNQELVITKLIEETSLHFRPLTYNAPDGEVFPDQAIEFGIGTLFDEGYDNILILDIDCIPLSTEALLYVFEKANQGILIGNVQRSNYLENNKHVFVGSSCLCLNRNLYEFLGVPKFSPTNRGDIAEELTYIAEDKNIPIEFFTPLSYEASPYEKENWELDGVMKPYGIGTTFGNQEGTPMFYHLFESRLNLHVDRFINKCRTILDN